MRNSNRTIAILLGCKLARRAREDLIVDNLKKYVLFINVIMAVIITILSAKGYYDY
jgi:hypothetical protein